MDKMTWGDGVVASGGMRCGRWCGVAGVGGLVDALLVVST